MKLLNLLLLPSAIKAVYYSNRASGITQDEILALNDRCNCANSTVVKIKNHLENYKKNHNSLEKTSNGPNVEGLISEIKEIANECTSSYDCKCPEGYFKSKDHRCLSFSRQQKTCREAVKACQGKFSSRLAVAKDPESLTNLQKYLKMAGHDDHFYWIGLSYNKDDQYNHSPSWRWDDQSYATSHTKASMGLYDNVNVKKAAQSINNQSKNSAQLRMIDVQSSLDSDLVRVAIRPEEDLGLSFETGFCGEGINESEQQRFRYVCEFLMFQVDVRPSNQKQKKNNL